MLGLGDPQWGLYLKIVIILKGMSDVWVSFAVNRIFIEHFIKQLIVNEIIISLGSICEIVNETL